MNKDIQTSLELLLPVVAGYVAIVALAVGHTL